MAYFLRLIASFLALLSVGAFAFTANPVYYMPNAAYVSPSAEFSSPGAACGAVLSGFISANSNPDYSYNVKSASLATGCQIQSVYKGANLSVFTYGISQKAGACPAGSTGTSPNCQCISPKVEINGLCVLPACPAGQHEEGGACVPNSCLPEQTRVNGLCVDPPPCAPGETRVNGVCQKSNCKAGATGGYYEMTSPSSVATCSHDGAGSYCSMLIEWQMTAQFDGGARYYGIGRLTGSSCAAAPDGPGSPTPTDPAKPNDPNAPKPTQPDPTKPGSQPGGSPGTPGGGSAPNTDGTCPSGSYKSGGSCYPNNPPPVPPDNDGKCPVGTVKVGAACAVLQPAPDQKPDDKKPSIFGGACNAVACEGDAIQCAIARDQYRRSCELMDKESAESALYGANKGKEGNQTADLPGNETINLESRIDTSDALGAGASGVSDLSVTVWNQSVTLPFSQINPYLAHLGSVLLAVSFLMAVRIVGRG